MAKKISQSVCLHLLPSWEGLELVVWDGTQVSQYHSLPLVGADASKRQLPEDFADTLKALYKAVEVPLTTPTTLVLPSLYTRDFALPEGLPEEEAYFTLLGEAERFYLFKKAEPVLDWVVLSEAPKEAANAEASTSADEADELPLEAVLYSAFPAIEVEKFLDAAASLSLPITQIDLNYTCLLRGLVATGAISEQLDEQLLWGFSFISEQTLFGAKLKGAAIQSFIERPISLSGGQDQQQIDEVGQDIRQFFSDTPDLSQLVLVHNAASLPAEALADSLRFPGKVVLIEQNQETLASLRSLEAATTFTHEPLYPCSLEGIGGCLSHELASETLSLNLLPRDAKARLKEAALQEKGLKWVIGLNIAIVVLLVLAWAVLWLWQLVYQAEHQVLQQRMKEVTKIENNERETRLKYFAYNALQRNVQLNNFIVQLAQDLPSSMWLATIQVDLEPEKAVTFPSIEVTGGTLLPEPVNQFSRELNPPFIKTPLAVDSLELEPLDETQTFYRWELRTEEPPK